jgi:hypothetical protein
MKFNNIALGLSFMSLIAVAGCGSSADDDPLTGTWSNSNCYGADSKPADIESCNTELTFGGDLEIELMAERISLAATATNPGCTTTRVITGQQWSTNHEEGTFSVDGSGSATIERTDCVNEADNMDESSTKDVSISAGEAEYTLSDDTLIVKSGSLAGTYTR